jgi:NAD(P)H-nitrite reductase large subunit
MTADTGSRDTVPVRRSSGRGAAPAARQYLLVGNGPAGWAAAEAIRQRDSQASITLLSQEGTDFYSRPGLAYLLTGDLPEQQLFARTDEDFRRLNLHRLAARVVGVDPARKQIRLLDGRWLTYDALLLATGAQAIRPQVEGIDLQGVVTLDTLADARHILRLARRARRAVVVGGGITALELAEGLVARGVQTHYLLRKDRYWGNVLDPEESALVEARLEHDGIRLHRRTDLLRVIGRKGKVVAVETSTGEIRAEILAVAIGIAPRAELARECGARVGRGILVDRFMQTSLPGIYAAGDVAEVLDPATGRTVLDSLWWIAMEQGRCAGLNMAGAGVAYQRPPAFNVTRIGGITTTILGAVGQGRIDEDLLAIARGDSESWRVQPDALAVEAGEALSRTRLLLGEQTILGAVVMGDQALSRPLQHLIRQQVDITPVRQRLLGEPGALGSTIHSFWQDWIAQAGKG